MAKRPNKHRKAELQPPRMKYALEQLEKAGADIMDVTDTTIHFVHKGCDCKLFPYTGWHTGKSIKDGRGINNLLKQLTTKQ